MTGLQYLLAPSTYSLHLPPFSKTQFLWIEVILEVLVLFPAAFSVPVSIPPPLADVILEDILLRGVEGVSW